MSLFDIETIAFTVLKYPVSYVELIGTLFGFISVFLASRVNILTWPTGILNEVFLFLLFFQVQLYADMFLQVYFLTVTLYGWYNWKVKTSENAIRKLSLSSLVNIILLIVVLSIPAGYLIQNLHLYLPLYFKIPAAFPYIDSIVMIASVFATILLSQKKLDSWYFWISVDVVCVVLYSVKGIYFLALEYLVFLGMAIYGYNYWRKQLING